jgi:hypothetical protein
VVKKNLLKIYIIKKIDYVYDFDFETAYFPDENSGKQIEESPEAKEIEKILNIAINLCISTTKKKTFKEEKLYQLW